MTWRKPRRDEYDPEFIWGMLFGTLCLATALLLLSLPEEWIPACLLFRGTGRPCPTCGAYRAGQALLQGRLAAAVRYQPLLSLLALAGLGYVTYAWTVVLLKLPRLRYRDTSRTGMAWIGLAGLVALALLNWLYLLSRYSL